MKVEGFIFLCISRYVQSGASLLSMYQEFSSKKFFIVVIGAVLRVMARRTSLAHQHLPCHVVSRVPVVSKLDDGTVVRHYRNWALSFLFYVALR